MTREEFSNGFDTLLNSHNVSPSFGEEASRQSIVLDEYEKSLFLTDAQKDLVVSLYNGKNSYGDSFESTEEMRRYLSSLVKEVSLKPIVNTNGIPLGATTTSKFFTLPSDLWFITLESVKVSGTKCDSNATMRVYPTKQDEFQNIKDNPFRGANDRRALRLDLSEGNVEIVCKYPVDSYYVRYVKRVSPIILENLPDGLTIDGIGKATDCNLHEALHQRILENAVRMALQSKSYGLERNRDN